MRTKRALVAAITLATAALTLSAGPSQAADAQHYFVSANGSDGNSGTDARHPFRTIQAAADRTLPGDTVYIMDGTYSESVPKSDVVVITRSGAPGAPITYRNYPGARPVIHPITGWEGILVSNASHLTFSGLTIQGNNKNLNLADAEKNASRDEPTYNTNCLFVRGTDGAHPSHITVRDNDVSDCAGGGIAFKNNGDHITIDRNRVHGNAWYSVYANSGITALTPTDTDPSDTGYKIRITNNVAYDNEAKVKWAACDCYSDGNGIIIDSTLHEDDDLPAYTGRTLIANNVAYNNGGSGIHAFSSSHVDIVNNTAYLNSRSPHLNYANIYAAYSDDVRLLNNVSYAREGKATNSTNRNTASVVYDYNVYFNGTTPAVQGPHDVIADPQFSKATVDPRTADFRPRAGSPAIDTGVAFDAVPRDVRGFPRPLGGGTDRGAYEILPFGTASE
ncbi:right-handed parallel beta-helix repeat-containing protein [Streptomyces sp. NPDC102451]|uniref:right-handed parallel beta-helix repeat-containing protein n=1 Tax=Streptomyces sp. NPDC102451 TaxID=3366177 RepID=UPI003826ECCC